MISDKKLSNRGIFLAIGVFAMLFSGVLYAWSILNAPFLNELKFNPTKVSLCFTLTMSFFCIGVFLGSKLFKLIGTKFALIIAGVLVGLGFALTGLVQLSNIVYLYIFYAVLAGLGIGIAYNVVIATVSAWFPDKKGFCSGMLMMAFGASTLILGKVITFLFNKENIGWDKTYVILGIALAVVLVITGLLLKKPHPDVKFPEIKAKKKADSESFEAKDFTTAEMMKRFTFWRAFICLVCLTAVGNSVISFANNLVMDVIKVSNPMLIESGVAASLATTLVGVLSICNGLGRILTGALFDAVGRRKTMLSANLITIVAAGVTLLAVYLHSLPLCIVGLCFTGISYGSCPTVVSAFTAAFYGPKNFPSNFAITNFNLIPASFIATAGSSLIASTGGYVAPFALLLGLSVFALILNFSIKRP